MKVDTSEVTANLDSLSIELRLALRDGLERYCMLIRDQARQLISQAPKHVDTGALRASITYSVEDSLHGEVYTNTPYAIYVHQGTGLYATEGTHAKRIPWKYYDERRGEWKWTSGITPNPFMKNARDICDNDSYKAECFKGVLE